LIQRELRLRGESIDIDWTAGSKVKLNKDGDTTLATVDKRGSRKEEPSVPTRDRWQEGREGAEENDLTRTFNGKGPIRTK